MSDEQDKSQEILEIILREAKLLMADEKGKIDDWDDFLSSQVICTVAQKMGLEADIWIRRCVARQSPVIPSPMEALVEVKAVVVGDLVVFNGDDLVRRDWAHQENLAEDFYQKYKTVGFFCTWTDISKTTESVRPYNERRVTELATAVFAQLQKQNIHEALPEKTHRAPSIKKM